MYFPLFLVAALVRGVKRIGAISNHDFIVGLLVLVGLIGITVGVGFKLRNGLTTFLVAVVLSLTVAIIGAYEITMEERHGRKLSHNQVSRHQEDWTLSLKEKIYEVIKSNREIGIVDIANKLGLEVNGPMPKVVGELVRELMAEQRVTQSSKGLIAK